MHPDASPLPYKAIHFFVSGSPGRVRPGDPLWLTPLTGQSRNFSEQAADTGWTIGDYLLAAEAFLSSGPGREALSSAMGQGRGRPGDWQVSLWLEKHGAYYHPIKVIVDYPDGQGRLGKASFVLNGAVSRQGADLMDEEIRLIAAAGKSMVPGQVPEVFGSGRIPGDKGPAAFFLGQWFEGFHEFHATGQGPDHDVVVWRPGRENLVIPMDRAVAAYENAAEILTRAYNRENGHEIFPWHHAAGDFIVDPEAEGMPVRLITVRGYQPLADIDRDTGGPFPGLLFFFLNLCLRMQLDRVDGVGEAVFLGRRVLNATIRGFFRGLSHTLSGNACQDFLAFAGRFDDAQFSGILIHLLEAWPPGASEADLIGTRLPGLCAEIRSLFKSGELQDFY